MSRKLKNFLDGFVAFMENSGSPRIYAKWSGIFAIGAVVERKAWLSTTKGKTYPNHYIILVGPAGIGKSVCTSTVMDLIEEIKSPENVIHVAPTSVTKASLIDALDNAERRIIRPTSNPPVETFNSLVVIANELGVFLPAWDGEFMSVLTDVWDNKVYAETRRTRNLSIKIPRPQINLLSATTPTHLNMLLPEGAWETGFMSRTLCVYSSEILYTDIFAEREKSDTLWKDLAADLTDIYKTWGEFSISEEAMGAINDWARSGGLPAPDHPKLLSYNTRRLHHLLKLCMVAALACDSELIITVDHFVEALDWLVELETFMPDIFKSMRTGGDAAAIEECYHYCFQQYMRRGNKHVPEQLMWAFLQDRVPAHNVARILEVMERAGLIKKEFMESGQGYKPMGKVQ
jgi:hypothetical protein